MKRLTKWVGACAVVMAGGMTAVAQDGPVRAQAKGTPWEYGVLFQGGKGLTDDRDDFKFFMAGGHAGKVLTPEIGSSLFRGNIEYAVEVFPYWQSATPKFQRHSCTPTLNPAVIDCVGPYTVGGTFHGVTITPIIVL